jgi:hypothetical protein
MKKKQLLLIVAGLIVAGITALTFYTNEKECQYVPRTDSEMYAENSSRGAAEYWHSRMADINGNIDPVAVENARKEARQQSRRKSVSETNFIWREMGPDNVGGRTRAILFDKTNPSIVYAGAVSGGLWKSTTEGQSWSKVNYEGTSITNDVANLFVSSITQAANGDIYIGTGESLFGSPRGGGSMTVHYGMGTGNGIWKKAAGSDEFVHLEETWTIEVGGQKAFAYVNRLAADPVDASRIYAATHRGLFVSNDAGTSWNTIDSLSTDKGKFTHDVKVGSDGTVVASIDAKTFIAKQGNLDNIERNLDGPWAPGGRLEFAFAPSNPNYIYCQAASSSSTLKGVYRTIDQGENWEVIGPGGSQYFQPLGDQGHYDNTIAVFPNDENRVLIGGQANMYRWSSTDESHWPQISNGYVNPLTGLYVHADHHAIVFHPDYGQGSNTILIGTDGGIFKSTNEGNSFLHASKNYNTVQTYKIDCDGFDNVICGNQDNGTQYNDKSGNTATNFTEIYDGDGATCFLSELDPRVTFASIYYGGIRRSQEPGTNMYATGRNFYNRTLLYQHWKDNANNIGNFQVAPFVTQYDLWESFYDEKSIDTVEWINIPQYISYDIFDEYYAELEQKYSDFSVDTTHFSTEDGGITVLSKLTIGAGETLKIPSSIYERPLYHVTTEPVYPNGVVKVQDTYQAMMAVPLLWENPQDTLYKLYITRKPVNFDVLAEDQPWAQVLELGIDNHNYNAFRALKFSQDGENLYFAVNNRLYRVSNLGNSRTYDQMHWTEDSEDYNLDVQAIETFDNFINDIEVDPNNADRVLVVTSGFGSGTHVWYSSNATTAASFTGKDGSGETKLPDAPVYAAIFNVGDGNQVLLGTHFGVYSTDAVGDPNPEWVSQNTNSVQDKENLPELLVSDLVQQIHTNKWNSGINNGGHIYVGTHGRGIFKSADWAVGVEEVPSDNDVNSVASNLKVYPNPVNDLASIEYDMMRTGDLLIEMYDLNGRLVRRENHHLVRGLQTIKLNVNDIEPGTYLISAMSNNNRKSAKVIVY